MNALVTFASRHGSTREIASEIADELRLSGLGVDLFDADEVTSITGYDAIILGSAIYMANWLPDARPFMDRFQSQLQTVPVWLFSSGPLGDDHPQPEGDPNDLAEFIERTHARDHRIFTGKLDRNVLGLRERLITRMISAPEGDFRDWNAIHGWAREIAASIHILHDGADAVLAGAADLRSVAD